MATALFFSLIALRECLLQGITDDMVLYLLNYEFKIASTIMFIITVLIMFLSMKYYMKSRIKDYSMFVVLGMRKKLLYLFVLAEYMIGWACSVCFGLLLGNGVVTGCQRILKSVDITYDISYSIHAKTYGITLAVSLAVMAGALFILMVNLDQRDLSQLLNEEERKETRPASKWWIIMVLLGFGLYLYAFRQYYTTDAGVMYAIIQWTTSGFLLLGFGGSFVLEAVKKRKGFYYRRALQINQFYHCYHSNMIFVSIVFAIHFLIIGYMTCSIIENLPLEKDRSMYPYDYVWIGQEKDEKFAKELTGKSVGEYSSYPMIRLTSFAGSEHVGISASTYKELTGRFVQPDDDEMYLFIEQTADDGTEIIDRHDYELIFQGVHTGKYRPLLYNVSLGSSEFEEQYNRYQIKKIEREIVWGSISMDNYHENTIVFSDERFEKEWDKVADQADEPNRLYVFNISGQGREKAGEELQEYVDTYGIKDEHEGYKQNVLYDVDRILKADFLRKLFNIISKGFIVVVFYISGIFIIGVKVFSEIPRYGRKYEHLRCMGMKRREERRNIAGELKIPLHISLIIGLIYGSTYLYVMTRCGDMSAARQIFCVKWWSMIIFIYLIVQMIFENILARILVKKVEG